MSKGSDPAKAAEWRDRFERFKKSEVKLEAFCESEGVTKANFYAWRHRLGLTKPRRRGAARPNEGTCRRIGRASSDRRPGR